MFSLHYFTFNPFQENTYVLADAQKNAIIIDPGMYFPEEKDKLKDFLEKKELTPVQVILTHAHLDHVFGLDWVSKNYGLEPYLHPDEKKVLDNGAKSGQKYGLSFPQYEGSVYFISEKDHILLGNDELSIVHIPGHSPGSVGFYSPAQNFLIGGDVLFREGIGRTDLPFGDQAQLLHSIRHILFTLPDEVRVFPGHGPATTIGYEKSHNPFLQ